MSRKILQGLVLAVMVYGGMMAESNNIKLVQESYDKEYCHQLELAYGKNFMSEGGNAEADRLLGDTKIEGKKVLDFGCGLGGNAFHFATKYNAVVTGFDVNEKMLARARKHTPEEIKDKVSFIVGDGGNILPFADQSFDVIFSKGAIIHLTLEQRRILYKEFYRVLKSGGEIVVFDPISPRDSWGKDIQELSDNESLPMYPQTLASYLETIKGAGFKNVTGTYESKIYAQFNNDIVARLQTTEAGRQFAKQYGQSLLDEHIKGYKGIAHSLSCGEMEVITFRASKIFTAAAFDIHGVLLKVLKDKKSRALKSKHAIHGLHELYGIREEVFRKECALCANEACRIVAKTANGRNTSHMSEAMLTGQIKWQLFAEHLKRAAQKQGVSEAVLEDLLFSCKPDSLPIEILDKGAALLQETGKSLGWKNVYILSNATREAMDHYLEEYPEIFKNIPSENIFLSVDAGKIKPHTDMFHAFLQQYKLKPENCLFVDDSPYNVAGAQECGMQGLVFKDKA